MLPRFPGSWQHDTHNNTTHIIPPLIKPCFDLGEKKFKILVNNRGTTTVSYLKPQQQTVGIRLDTRTGKLVKQCGGTLKKCLSVEAKDGQVKYVALKLNSLVVRGSFLAINTHSY